VARTVAILAAGLALAPLAPGSARAACATSVPFGQCVIGGGAIILRDAASPTGGTFWVPGSGADALGPGDTAPGFGDDAGLLAGFPLPSDPYLSFLGDFLGDGATRCLYWDWSSPGSDGCADGVTEPMAVVVREGRNNLALLQVGPRDGTYDFDAITNGGPSPFGGEFNGVTTSPAVHAFPIGGRPPYTLLMSVEPLAIVSYDDQGGAREVPGTPRLTGLRQGARQVVAEGGGSATVEVDAESDLCWELADGPYSVLLGCEVVPRHPPQHVLNARASIVDGQVIFTWEVSAQVDVLGFNIVQRNESGDWAQFVNQTLIPRSGANDWAPASYRYVARWRDLRARRSFFEINLRPGEGSGESTRVRWSR
jgi:hypothetical protein